MDTALPASHLAAEPSEHGPQGRCQACGFAAVEWRVRDAGDLFMMIGDWWEMATVGDGRAAVALGAAAAHAAESARVAIEAVLAADGSARTTHRAPAPADTGPAVTGRLPTPAEVRRRLGAAGGSIGELAASADAAWHRPVPGDNLAVSAASLLIEAAHDLSHRCTAIGRALAGAGAGAAHDEGTVAQISVSGGGIPKTPVQEAAVGWRGVEGDRQGERRFHGRPFQAVCLWSAEVIAELAGRGHRVSPGAAGENLTIAGLDWRALRPGAALAAGTALLELASPAVPCRKQAQWFSDGDFRRISYGRHPEWVRWYAWVRRPGYVRTGDAVVVEP